MSFPANRYDRSPDPPSPPVVSRVRTVVATFLPSIGNIPVVQVSPAPDPPVDPSPMPRSPEGLHAHATVAPLSHDTARPSLEDELAELDRLSQSDRLRRRFESPSSSDGRGAHSSGGSRGSSHRRGSSGGSPGLSPTPTRRSSLCPGPQFPGEMYYGEPSSPPYLRATSQSQPGSGSTSPIERGRGRGPGGYSQYSSRPDAEPPFAQPQHHRRSSSGFRGRSQSLSRDQYDETKKHRTSEQVIRNVSKYTNKVIKRLDNGGTSFDRSAMRGCYSVLKGELTKAWSRTNDDSLKDSLSAIIEPLGTKVLEWEESTSPSLTSREVEKALRAWRALEQRLSTLPRPSMQGHQSSARSRHSSRSKSRGGRTVSTEGKDLRRRLGLKEPYVEELPRNSGRG